MKKIKFLKNYFFLIIMSIFLILILSGCSSTNENDLNEKAQEEIKFIESKVIAMINSLNNIKFNNYSLIEENFELTNKSSQGGSEESSKGGQNQESGGSESSSSSGNNGSSDSTNTVKFELKSSSILGQKNSTINWEYLKKDVENINSRWANTIIDLHGLNVKNDDILNFSNTLDKCAISIKEENKTITMVNLANLYSYLPNYLSQFSKNQKEISIAYIKSNLLNSYALVEQDRWDDVKKEVNTAIENLTTMMNNVEVEESLQNEMSKLYVMLNEFNNTVNLKDKELYYMKYKNIMEVLLDF